MEARRYMAAANTMLEAIANADGESDRIVAQRVMRVGCRSLEDLVKDMESGGDLDWAYRHLSSIDKRENQTSATNVHAVRELFATFLTAERELLAHADVPLAVRRMIIMAAQDMLKLLARDELGANNWLRIRQNVSELKTTVCSHSERDASLEMRRGILFGAAQALAGGGVILLNASADAIATLGMLPWMTVHSGKLGGALLSNAGKGVFAAVRDRKKRRRE